MEERCFSPAADPGFWSKDIWLTRLDEKNKWTEPLNLGSTINTDGDEMSPFIHLMEKRSILLLMEGWEWEDLIFSLPE